MKSEVAVAVVLAGAVFISADASADANLDLAKARQCLSCHAVDKTTLAPSFQSIALKYKGQNATPGQVTMLTETIKKGTPEAGGYHWGTMTMPSPGARPVISDAEATQLTQWILSLK